MQAVWRGLLDSVVFGVVSEAHYHRAAGDGVLHVEASLGQGPGRARQHVAVGVVGEDVVSKPRILAVSCEGSVAA